MARRSRFWASPTWKRQRLDNPLIIPRALSFLTYRAWTAQVRGSGQFSAKRVARQHSDSLLQLSRDGRAGDDVYRHHGDCSISCCGAANYFASRWMLWILLLSRAVSVYRQHRGMDHGGTGPPAVVDLRADAHASGNFAASFRRQRVVHADRVFRNVHGAEYFVFVSGVSRN